MKALILILWLIMLPPSKLHGGLSAPKSRLFCFKENITAQDSAHREVCGRYRVTLINLGHLFYQNNTELAMCTSESHCSNCPLTENPYDQLQAKFSMLDFAIEGAVNLLAADQSGYPQSFASGLKQIWTEADEALKRYLQSKGDEHVC